MLASLRSDCYTASAMSRKFTVRHQLECTPEQFWERIHHNPDFNKALYVDDLGYGYKLLKDDRQTGERASHVTPVVDAPAPIRKALGDSVSFEEQGRLERGGTSVYRFSIVPGVWPDKIHISGAMTAEPAPGGKCHRTVAFDVGCTAFGIGGLFERFVQKEVSKAYDQSAVFTNEYLARYEPPTDSSREAATR